MLSAHCGHRAQWERSVQKIASAVDYLVCSNYLKAIRDIFVGSYSAKSARHREGQNPFHHITEDNLFDFFSAFNTVQLLLDSVQHTGHLQEMSVTTWQTHWIMWDWAVLRLIWWCVVPQHAAQRATIVVFSRLGLSSSQDWVCAAPNLLSIILLWRSTWYNCNSKMQTAFFSQFYFTVFKNLF